jgi:hypothetical protein
MKKTSSRQSTAPFFLRVVVVVVVVFLLRGGELGNGAVLVTNGNVSTNRRDEMNELKFGLEIFRRGTNKIETDN